MASICYLLSGIETAVRATQILEHAQVDFCFCPELWDLKSSSGDIHQLTAQSGSQSTYFWVSLQPFLVAWYGKGHLAFVASVWTCNSSHKVCCILSPFQVVPGPTSQWILSPAYQFLKVILVVVDRFSKACCFILCQSYQQHLRQLNWSCLYKV